MKTIKNIALVTGAIVASFVIASASQTVSAQKRSLASLTSPGAVSPQHPLVIELKCHVERSDDGTSRVVIVNTTKRVVYKGSAYSYTILGNGGIYFSTFEGRMASDLRPNARVSDEFQQEIVSCRATVRLTR